MGVLLIANGPDGPDGPDGPLMLLLPRPDYAIEDTRFVSGLRGTGSKDIVVDDAFVPEHRTVLMELVEDLREGRSPGRPIHDTANQWIPQQCILTSPWPPPSSAWLKAAWKPLKNG